MEKMAELIREERYIFLSGNDQHVIRVQELISGSAGWPDRFRVHVPASHMLKAKKFYGTTARETAERAIEYLTSPVCTDGPPLTPCNPN